MSRRLATTQEEHLPRRQQYSSSPDRVGQPGTRYASVIDRKTAMESADSSACGGSFGESIQESPNASDLSARPSTGPRAYPEPPVPESPLPPHPRRSTTGAGPYADSACGGSVISNPMMASGADIYDIIEEENTAMENVPTTRQRPPLAKRTTRAGSNTSGRGILKRGNTRSSLGSTFKAGFSTFKSISRYDPDSPSKSVGFRSREESLVEDDMDIRSLESSAVEGRMSSITPQTPVSRISRGNTNGSRSSPFTMGFTTASRLSSFRRATGFEKDEDDTMFFDPISSADPQEKRLFPSAYLVRLIALTNVLLGVLYLYWRIENTFPSNITRYQVDHPQLWWWWAFYITEIFLAIAVWIGHTQRLFPVQRVKVTMDDLTSVDNQVGYNARVAILLPTAGEQLGVVMKALLGASSQRLWDSGQPVSGTLRLIVLDEKRRLEVYRLAAGVHRIGELISGRRVRHILQAEGVMELTPNGFASWCRDASGFERKHLYNDTDLNEAVEVLQLMEQMCASNGIQDSFALETKPTFEGTFVPTGPSMGRRVPKAVPSTDQEMDKDPMALERPADPMALEGPPDPLALDRPPAPEMDPVTADKLPSESEQETDAGEETKEGGETKEGPLVKDKASKRRKKKKLDPNSTFKESTRSEEFDRRAALLGAPANEILPGFYEVFGKPDDQDLNNGLPTMVYYSRKNNGTPRISPKAGNMNAAIFPIDYPDDEPLIGNATIVVVNDARHQLESDFLQRTVPYFFELGGKDSEGLMAKRYRWAKVAYVQTPQRFRQELPNDPLGNHASLQYDVINHGKDGVGGVASSGQGSLWRVEALKGTRPNGSKAVDPNDLSLVGTGMGFRSELLIEDTHTSIEMFRQGWRSVYVNEPGEVLAWCTLQPSSLTWRVKQVLRWHQGAVQLLLFKGIGYTSFGGNFPSIWHRVYAFDQATYYLQALPGYVLLVMPVVYGITGTPPFETSLDDYFKFFTAFIVSALLPTAISSRWRKVDSKRLTRDEQTWLSTTYVQIYAFLQVFWTMLTKANPENAWVAKVPTWPLSLAFIAQFGALAGAIYRVVTIGFVEYYANFFSIIVVAFLAMHALWPMVSLSYGWAMPSFYYIKMFSWVILGLAAVLLAHLFNTSSQTTL